MQGQSVILSVKPYDPRSFLSGYYLRYTVDYELSSSEICNSQKNQEVISKRAYICLKPLGFSYEKPRFCQIMVKGVCSYGGFKAGIERYYLPEKKAKYWNSTLRNLSLQKKNLQIVISVIANGKAQVKDFLIEGKSINQLKNP